MKQWTKVKLKLKKKNKIEEWYIYTVEYYSALKGNEIESFMETWMDLESVIHNEVSQKNKNY